MKVFLTKEQVSLIRLALESQVLRLEKAKKEASPPLVGVVEDITDEAVFQSSMLISYFCKLGGK